MVCNVFGHYINAEGRLLDELDLQFDSARG